MHFCLASRASGLAALAAHLLISSTAVAQDVPAEDGSEEVIVTATKRGKDVQEVPASVSALSGVELANRGITNVEQVAMALPNISFGMHAGASFITIRGVGSTINSGVTETTVATYVDGIYLPRATMGTLQQVDLERVEVLRGPQGTLYGRNATGGAVNFISKAPTDEFMGEVNVMAGSRDGYGASGYVSGPVADGLLFRISGGYNEHQSYMKVVPSGDTIEVSAAYVRGALRWDPTDDLTIDLSLKYERDEGADTYQQAFSLPTVPLPPGTLVTIEPNRTAADFPFDQSTETFIANLTLNWEINDSVSFRSTSGYINHHSNTSFDGDNTSLPLQAADDFERPSNAVSQEFVFFGDTGSFEWLAGVFMYHENFTNFLPVLLPSGVPGALPPGTTVDLNLKHEGTDTLAFFTDVTWSVTDSFRINAGLRYNAEKKEFLFSTGVTIPGVGFVGAPDEESEISSYRFLPKIGLQYDITDEANVYAQYQQGFKSGGHDIALPRTFGPELLDSYELGLKSRWIDGALTANAALFYYQYDGMQITNNTGPTTTQVENADARILGFEGEVVWDVNEDVNVNLALTLLDAEYTEFESFDAARPELGLLDLDGVQVIQSPDYTIKAGAQWRIPLGDSFVSNVVLRGDVFHTDDVLLRYFATDNDTQEGYTLVNLSATFNDADEMTALRVFVNNVGDVEYKRMIDYLLAVGTYDGNYGEPLSWGVQLTRRF